MGNSIKDLESPFMPFMKSISPLEQSIQDFEYWQNDLPPLRPWHDYIPLRAILATLLFPVFFFPLGVGVLLYLHAV